MDSSKRVAVITGAASGIGLALSHLCLQKGMKVVLADINTEQLHKILQDLQVSFAENVAAHVCDVSEPDSVNDLACYTIKTFGRVDWLFNNAGISGHLAPIWQLPIAQIRQVMDINLYGVIHGIHSFLPIMFQQKHRSHIINVASFYGLCSGSQMAAYAMSKHAVIALSESLYFDLQRNNKAIDVSVACPSFVSTGLLQNSKPENDKGVHTLMADLIERARPAEDIAKSIINGVEKSIFYILPDKEVKDYCEQRTRAIVDEKNPHCHSMEQIVRMLSKRAEKVD